MIWRIPLWSKCWPVLLFSLASVMDKLSSALELMPQENEFWESFKSSTSSKIAIKSTFMETKKVESSESSRLIRLEQEISRLNHKFSLQDSKNVEYDKTVDFVKEIKIKQTESESRLNKIESKISIEQHHIVKRQNSITSKPIITTRLPCIPKNSCAFDFKNSSNSSDAFFSRNKTATICIPKNACAFDFKSPSASASFSDNITTSITQPSALGSIYKSSKPPSTCKDLSSSGHTSNGIYLLYDSNIKKVSMAFCDFDHNKGNQLLLGFMSVKSLPEGVYFYAQRTQTFWESNANIPFDRVLMNEGGGLNGSTGIFRAPKPGIYRFWFNCQKTHIAPHLHIDFKVNGANVGNAYTTSSATAVHAVVKLKTGDEVLLFLRHGQLYDDDTPDTHFSGWLVDEELNISLTSLV